ncbi:hypothetical protein ECJURUA2010_1488 [Escherichia coli Jurua 20/10]|nr:hypothetical protein ECJURUA2010_1488 [Escherichia coli Jurua 20/10]
MLYPPYSPKRHLPKMPLVHSPEFEIMQTTFTQCKANGSTSAN